MFSVIATLRFRDRETQEMIWNAIVVEQ